MGPFHRHDHVKMFSMDEDGMKRVGLIGCGDIGRVVARALLQGKAGRHTLAGVMVRTVRELDGFSLTGDANAFFAERYGIVIDRFGVSWKIMVESKVQK